MGLLDAILEKLFGKVHFYIVIGKKPAAEILFEDNEIIIDIKNPILALEAGLEEIAKKKRLGSKRLKNLKAMGYRVKLRYKRLEFEV